MFGIITRIFKVAVKVVWHMQDLREAYLEDFGGLGEERDQTGDWFDARLQELATCAFEREEGTE